MTKRNLIDSMKKIIVALGGAESVEDIDENNVVEIADKIAEAISDGGSNSLPQPSAENVGNVLCVKQNGDNYEWSDSNLNDTYKNLNKRLTKAPSNVWKSFKHSENRYIQISNDMFTDNWVERLFETDSTGRSLGATLWNHLNNIYAYLPEIAHTNIKSSMKSIYNIMIQLRTEGYWAKQQFGNLYFRNSPESSQVYKMTITDFSSMNMGFNITLNSSIDNSSSDCIGSFDINGNLIKLKSRAGLPQLDTLNTQANYFLRTNELGSAYWGEINELLPFIVNCSGTTEESNVNIDKTFQEITNAYNSGCQVIAKYKLTDNLFYLAPLVVLSDSWVQFYTYQFGEDEPNSHMAVRISIYSNNNNAINYVDNL